MTPHKENINIVTIPEMKKGRHYHIILEFNYVCILLLHLPVELEMRTLEATEPVTIYHAVAFKEVFYFQT